MSIFESQQKESLHPLSCVGIVIFGEGTLKE
jgi:hypothetical protein